jgi:hypothetical protein
VAKFWVENLAAGSVAVLKGTPAPAARPVITTDPRGWPASAKWGGTELFAAGLADFIAVRPEGFAPRAVLGNLAAGKPGTVKETPAVPGETAVEETGHTLVYTQTFTHPSLRRGSRRMELWKTEPHARITVKFYRNSSDAPEAFWVAFPLPTGETPPRLSVGGVPFVPYQDQIPGTAMDYFAIDGHAHYATGAGDWLWVSRDAPLVSFGKPEVWARRKTAAPGNRLLAMVFNNFWYTNFVGDEHGAMEFVFDLVWRRRIDRADALARTLSSVPMVVQR